MRLGSDRRERAIASAALIGMVALLSIFIMMRPPGQAPPGTQAKEQLIIGLAPDGTLSHLIIDVDNNGTTACEVTQVTFDNSVVPPSKLAISGDFNQTASSVFSLRSGGRGTMTVDVADLPPLGPEETYEVILWTSTGNHYSALITWP